MGSKWRSKAGSLAIEVLIYYLVQLLYGPSWTLGFLSGTLMALLEAFVGRPVAVLLLDIYRSLSWWLRLSLSKPPNEHGLRNSVRHFLLSLLVQWSAVLWWVFPELCCISLRAQSFAEWAFAQNNPCAALVVATMCFRPESPPPLSFFKCHRLVLSLDDVSTALIPCAPFTTYHLIVSTSLVYRAFRNPQRLTSDLSRALSHALRSSALAAWYHQGTTRWVLYVMHNYNYPFGKGERGEILRKALQEYLGTLREDQEEERRRCDSLQPFYVSQCLPHELNLKEAIAYEHQTQRRFGTAGRRRRLRGTAEDYVRPPLLEPLGAPVVHLQAEEA